MSTFPRGRTLTSATSSLPLAGALIVALLLGGCTSSAAEPDGEPPAAIEAIPGSDVKKVILTQDAATALGVETAVVTAGLTAGQLTIPYAAILYYTDGTTWAYTSPGENEFVRVPVTVTAIAGGSATLSVGPSVGTSVVVLGAPEMLGAELEISGEQ